MSIRIAIVQFPGSNCERETSLAVKRAGMEPVDFLWNGPKESLEEFAGFVIVGGFSYEDRARAGAIAALDPIMQTIKEQSKLGKPILGICNGAQILVEAGLVPGLENDQIAMSLTDNKRIQQGKILGTGYYNAWVYMRLAVDYQLNAFTRLLKPRNILNVPVAHATGRFIIPPGLLAEMRHNGQCVFQYCDADGNRTNEFPVNPNGSVDNVAAVTNKMGNVMAIMPHPERTLNGDPIFHSMHDYIVKGYVSRVAPLHYFPRENSLRQYHPQNKYELIVELAITDNHAMSVENALSQGGIPIKIKRYIHWEITCDSPEIFEKMKATELLYNHRKELILSKDALKKTATAKFLVRAKEDWVGQQKLQMLKDHFALQGVQHISHSILWEFEKTYVERVLNSSILYNPYAHDCYYY